ncbi:MAG: tetratricopeptide repeat protein [bacterium]|nr:tetratricopeptide repeat protein [bacterium]
MIVLVFLTALVIYITLKTPLDDTARNLLPDNISLKIDRMWKMAQEAIIDKKYLRAEKILLTILRFDEKNATAYNRLGIIYAGQKNYEEAIECFEIAQSLESSPSSLHNVGLIYLETGDFTKAALAFEQAIKMEDNLPTRYIAYSRALQGLEKDKAAIAAMEKAVELDGRPQNLRQLGQLYLKAEQTDKAQEIKERLDQITQTRQKLQQKLTENSSAKIIN